MGVVNILYVIYEIEIAWWNVKLILNFINNLSRFQYLDCVNASHEIVHSPELAGRDVEKLIKYLGNFYSLLN